MQLLTLRQHVIRAGFLHRSWWLLLFAAAALVLPGNASAHARSGIVAVDYQARLDALPEPLRPVIAARIYESDRAVRLTLAPGRHTATVLGYLHEPFVRLTAGGVEVNASAPTAGAAGLTTRVPAHSVANQERICATFKGLRTG